MAGVAFHLRMMRRSTSTACCARPSKRIRTPTSPSGRSGSLDAEAQFRLVTTSSSSSAAMNFPCTAIVSKWSNGQTEGQITKLKLVKRQMYGCGKLDLL
ncbi:hypothetical protein BH09PSE3_BH09PSE3_19440 [soil metagenome]